MGEGLYRIITVLQHVLIAGDSATALRALSLAHTADFCRKRE